CSYAVLDATCACGSLRPPLRTLPPLFFFFFHDTATTEIYTLSLHDALPISAVSSITARASTVCAVLPFSESVPRARIPACLRVRSEEHTSELQSLRHLVCRLLLEKKKKKIRQTTPNRTQHTQSTTQT